MHDDDRSRARRDLRFEGAGIDRVIAPHIAEDRDSAGMQDREGRREKRVGGNNHLVPGLNAQGEQRRVKGGRAAGAGDSVRGPDPRSPPGFELPAPGARPIGDPARPKRLAGPAECLFRELRPRREGLMRRLLPAVQGKLFTHAQL